jgi:hypothetical protein
MQTKRVEADPVLRETCRVFSKQIKKVIDIDSMLEDKYEEHLDVEGQIEADSEYRAEMLKRKEFHADRFKRTMNTLPPSRPHSSAIGTRTSTDLSLSSMTCATQAAMTNEELYMQQRHTPPAGRPVVLPKKGRLQSSANRPCFNKLQRGRAATVPIERAAAAPPSPSRHQAEALTMPIRRAAAAAPSPSCRIAVRQIDKMIAKGKL